MNPLDDLLPLPPATFLVLLALRGRARHGYGIKKEVRARSDGRIDLDPGGLYRLIGRLEVRGVIRSTHAPADEPDDDRRRLFYTLTAAGERILAAEARRLASLVASPDVAALINGVRV
ncbi:MAG TPA: helix-turn-helix transcriptional regulator [Gemmatimonadaceae bacterium]|jgi:DNA-binding PadR family transcriptional regulator|nr:helix-turn-helix transcriptional regulator [Gemmatimonadaceae bacterium]